MLAVSVKATVNQAATDINPLVNILDIFNSHVLPEVQDPNVNDRPIVKADAVKMVCLFRQHFPAPFLLSLFPHLVAHLASTHVVIQTYAAVCIEKFLSIKDRSPAGAQVPRLAVQDVVPLLQPLLGGLFTVLDNPSLTENDYAMRSVMRVLAVAGTQVAPFTPLVLHKLTQALERVCKNPVNPHYNHYLFECISLLVRHSCVAIARR